MLPEPGKMVGVSSVFTPVLVKGLVVHPDKPLNFDFIVDSGNDSAEQAVVQAQSEKIVRYFLAALTVPEEQLWVNLSPYEKDRIIDEGLGQTVLGRDMLAQDYVLKQLTASLIYPEDNLGKDFWGRIYKEAQDKFGTTDIPVDTFNKVWIVPQKAVVFEKNNAVYVTEARLKVMLDSDYVAARHSEARIAEESPDAADLSKSLIRQVILPAIEKEVNEGKNFATLRQIYHAAILAKWYRELIQDTLMSKAYVGQNKISGVNSGDKTLKEQIYQRYIAAYKQGVFDYIKEEVDQTSGEAVPRKYFSGGLDKFGDIKLDKAQSPDDVMKVGKIFQVDFAMDSFKDLSDVDKKNKATGSADLVKKRSGSLMVDIQVTSSALMANVSTPPDAAMDGFDWFFTIAIGTFIFTPVAMFTILKVSDITKSIRDSINERTERKIRIEWSLLLNNPGAFDPGTIIEMLNLARSKGQSDRVVVGIKALVVSADRRAIGAIKGLLSYSAVNMFFVRQDPDSKGVRQLAREALDQLGADKETVFQANISALSATDVNAVREAADFLLSSKDGRVVEILAGILSGFNNGPTKHGVISLQPVREALIKLDPDTRSSGLAKIILDYDAWAAAESLIKKEVGSEYWGFISELMIREVIGLMAQGKQFTISERYKEDEPVGHNYMGDNGSISMAYNNFEYFTTERHPEGIDIILSDADASQETSFALSSNVDPAMLSDVVQWVQSNPGWAIIGAVASTVITAGMLRHWFEERQISRTKQGQLDAKQWVVRQMEKAEVFRKYNRYNRFSEVLHGIEDVRGSFVYVKVKGKGQVEAEYDGEWGVANTSGEYGWVSGSGAIITPAYYDLDVWMKQQREDFALKDSTETQNKDAAMVDIQLTSSALAANVLDSAQFSTDPSFWDFLLMGVAGTVVIGVLLGAEDLAKNVVGPMLKDFMSVRKDNLKWALLRKTPSILGRDKIVRMLVEAINSSNRPRMNDAIRILGVLKNEWSAKEIEGLFSSSMKIRRDLAREALDKLRADKEVIFRANVQALNAHNSEPVLEALGFLVASKDLRAVEAIKNLLLGGNKSLRMAAREALDKLGADKEVVFQANVQALKAYHLESVLEALGFLVASKDLRAVEVITNFLLNNNKDLRKSAREALDKLGADKEVIFQANVKLLNLQVAWAIQEATDFFLTSNDGRAIDVLLDVLKRGYKMKNVGLFQPVRKALIKLDPDMKTAGLLQAIADYDAWSAALSLLDSKVPGYYREFISVEHIAQVVNIMARGKKFNVSYQKEMRTGEEWVDTYDYQGYYETVTREVTTGIDIVVSDAAMLQETSSALSKNARYDLPDAAMSGKIVCKWLVFGLLGLGGLVSIIMNWDVIKEQIKLKSQRAGLMGRSGSLSKSVHVVKNRDVSSVQELRAQIRMASDSMRAPLGFYRSLTEEDLKEAEKIWEQGNDVLVTSDMYVMPSTDESPGVIFYVLKVEAASQDSIPDKAMKNLGGIDIQNIDVNKTGNAKIQFNDDALKQVLSGGFDGFTPVFIKMTPVENPLMILGVGQGALQGAGV
jgi:hypothetical protein